MHLRLNRTTETSWVTGLLLPPMKSLWVTPDESQTDERGVAAGDEVDEEEEEEATKVIAYISRILLLLYLFDSGGLR